MRNLINELEIEARHADHMAGMAEMWMRKAKDAQRTIMALVNAAGGTIDVSYGDLAELPAIELIKVEQPHNMTVRFHTRKKPPTNTKEGE